MRTFSKDGFGLGLNIGHGCIEVAVFISRHSLDVANWNWLEYHMGEIMTDRKIDEVDPNRPVMGKPFELQPGDFIIGVANHNDQCLRLILEADERGYLWRYMFSNWPEHSANSNDPFFSHGWLILSRENMKDLDEFLQRHGAMWRILVRS